jgi:hypothetical protein
MFGKPYVPEFPALDESVQQPFFVGPGLKVSLGRFFQDGYIQGLIRDHCL